MFCKLCNFSSDVEKYFNQHCNTKTHLFNEQQQKYCVLCDKNYKSIGTYNNHKKNTHIKKTKKTNKLDNSNNTNNNSNSTNSSNSNSNNTTNINNNSNNTSNTANNIMNTSDNNTLNNINNNIIHINDKIDEVKEEIHNSKKEVVTVVNKAITKASSLIKYLMQNHRSVPPLKKIKKEECIPILRLEYDCPEKEGDYSLQKMFIRDYSNNIFIPNIAKSILKIINHEQQDKQPIYNTDSSRYNYVIKTTSELWNEDKSGIKFTDYIIRPLLRYIREINEDYINNILDKVNMRKNTLKENEDHIDLLSKTLKLESDINNERLITPILKELSPFLRYLQSEIEELEKYNEMEKIQKELENIIKDDSDDDLEVPIHIVEYVPNKKNIVVDIYDDDLNDNYITKIKKRLI